MVHERIQTNLLKELVVFTFEKLTYYVFHVVNILKLPLHCVTTGPQIKGCVIYTPLGRTYIFISVLAIL